MHFTSLVTAAVSLKWDPQIRGMLFVGIAVTLLIGSVFLLLATNTGFRMGLWLTLCGLFGWLTLLTFVWTVFALKQGPPDPSTHEAKWVVKEIITGNIEAQTGNPATLSFAHNAAAKKDGWLPLSKDDKDYADTASSTDNALAPAAPAVGAEVKPTPKPTYTGVSPFSKPDDYIAVNSYYEGGGTYWPFNIGVRSLKDNRNKGTIEADCKKISGKAATDCKNPDKLLDCKDGSGKHCIAGQKYHYWQRFENRITKGPLHKPHYAVVQVQPVVHVDLTKLPLGAAPPKPVADPTKPITTVVMVRQLGTQRMLPAVWFAGALTIFVVLAYGLHRRDKAIWKLQATQVATA